MDDRQGESVLRQGAGQSLLEALLRPRPGRAGRRHASDQSGHESRVARRAGRSLPGQQLRSEGAGSHDLPIDRPISSAPSRTATTRATSRIIRASTRSVWRPKCCSTPSIEPPEVPPNSPALPAGTKAIQLPDTGFNSYFLTVFGRPEASSACECERSGEANLAQSLHLLNSSDVQNKLSFGGGRAAKLSGDLTRSSRRQDSRGVHVRLRPRT